MKDLQAISGRMEESISFAKANSGVCICDRQ